MKFLTLFFIFSSFYVFSQNTWIDQGATWVYDFQTPGAPHQGAIKYKYVGDTIIQSKNCQMIVSTHNTFLLGSLYDVDIDTNYTYVNGDTIFWYDNGHFFIYLNFNAVVGDSWVITNKESPIGASSCDSLSTVVVTNVGFSFFNNYQHRYIELVTLSGSSWALSGVYTNKFGYWRQDLNYVGYSYPGNPLFPHVNDVSCWNTSIYNWYIYQFHCYWDDSYGIYNQLGGWCEESFYLDSPELQKEKVFINPNPVIDFVKINNLPKGLINAKIIDLAGKIIFEITQKDLDQIDLSILEKGVYLLMVDVDKMQKHTFKFVKE